LYRNLCYETAVQRSVGDAGLHLVHAERMLRANMILTHGVLHRLWLRRHVIILGYSARTGAAGKASAEPQGSRRVLTGTVRGSTREAKRPLRRHMVDPFTGGSSC
jgi:hypothetical protein